MVENMRTIKKMLTENKLKMHYDKFPSFQKDDIEDDLKVFIKECKINYSQKLMSLSKLPIEFFFSEKDQLLRYKQVLDAKNGSRKRIEDQLQRNLARVEHYVPLKEYQSFYMKCVTDHSFLPLCSTFTPKNANLEEINGPEKDSIMFICNNLNMKKQKKLVKKLLKTIKMFELDYIDDGIITDPEMQNEETIEAFDILIQKYLVNEKTPYSILHYSDDVAIRSHNQKIQVIYREMQAQEEEKKYCEEHLKPEIVELVLKLKIRLRIRTIEYKEDQRVDIDTKLANIKRGDSPANDKVEKPIKFEFYQPPDSESNDNNKLYLLFADEKYQDKVNHEISNILNGSNDSQYGINEEDKQSQSVDGIGSSYSQSEGEGSSLSFKSNEKPSIDFTSQSSYKTSKYSETSSKNNPPQIENKEESKNGFSMASLPQSGLQYLISNLGVLYTTQAIKNGYLLLNPPECKNCDVREIELVKSLFNILKKSFNHSEQVQGLDSGLIGQMVIGELINQSRYLFEPDSTFVWAFIGEDGCYKMLDPNLNFYLETLYQEKRLEYQDLAVISQNSEDSKISRESSENASNSFLMTKKYYDLEGEHRIKVSIKTKSFEKHLTKKKYKDMLK